jgi:sialic acid synthase SpsE
MDEITSIHVIAEAGTNHNGQVAIGKKLVDLAKKAQADSVKFQVINTDGLYLPGQYKFGHYDINEVRALREQFALTDEEYESLNAYCDQLKIPFTASIFDIKGLDLLESFSPPYIKIASTDLNNTSLLRRVAERRIKMIISTGMSTLGQIENTVREITKNGFDDIVLMHCVSCYPAPLEEMNLNFLDTLRHAFGFPIGLSDHTQSSIAACIAVSKGISYVEKHYTLDASQVGFDHKYAAEPDTFIQYVKDIRNAEKALAFNPVKIGEKELYTAERAKRSIYAARKILPNEVITESDLLIVRPSNILRADQIDDVIGKRASRQIDRYQPLSFDLIK